MILALLVLLPMTLMLRKRVRPPVTLILLLLLPMVTSLAVTARWS